MIEDACVHRFSLQTYRVVVPSARPENGGLTWGAAPGFGGRSTYASLFEPGRRLDTFLFSFIPLVLGFPVGR
jgi:hypothetical protein